MKIKYVGPRSKVVAGKHLFSGESMEVTEKQAEGLRGDPELEFANEKQVTLLKVQLVEEETATQPPSAAPLSPKSDEAGFRGRKGKGKKK